MKRKIFVILIAAIFFLPKIYSQDTASGLAWNDLKWGMKPQEVIQKYNGKIEMFPRRSIYFQCYADFSIGGIKINGFAMRVIPQFSNIDDSLVSVVMKPDEKIGTDIANDFIGDYIILAKDLIVKYGKPIFEYYDDQSKYRSMVWMYGNTVIELNWNQMKKGMKIEGVTAITIIYSKAIAEKYL